ncbi:ATP-binding protein [Streptomyces sp. RS2]|uniref:ATP-binding protein n=1 Tax=Streptomyces tendae TaxID=1932 RepID=A0ABW7RYX9_STRTE|nr:ATP-binding protein [Streptomyces sp. RS2]MCW1095095.1 ATP-binding protein [Streptomyces sp. RS2]
MAYIRSFSVSGLAGRKKTIRRTLQRDTNIFWGFNGSGKTSLLKILHSALSNDASTLLRVPFTSATVTFYSTNHDCMFTRKISKEALTDAFSEALSEAEEFRVRRRLVDSVNLHWETTIKGKQEVSERVQRNKFRHTYLPISRVNEPSKQTRSVVRTEMGSGPLDEEMLDRLFAQQIKGIWQNYNTNSLMTIRDVQEKGLALILSSVLGSKKRTEEAAGTGHTDGEQAYGMVRNFFANQRLRRHLNIGTYSSFAKNYANDPLLRTVVAEISEVQKEIELALEPQIRIQQLINDMYGGDKKLTFRHGELEITSAGERVPIESLSGGEKQLLRLLLECLATEEAPILVDEPELSMHVDWQHRLIESMRIVNPNTQILMATHSPEIMANIPDDRIFPL